MVKEIHLSKIDRSQCFSNAGIISNAIFKPHDTKAIFCEKPVGQIAYTVDMSCV